MSIEYHRNLLSDFGRNAAFHAALQRVIKPGETTVADIGSGTGLLGFLASQLGAKSVTLYEQAGIMEVAKRLARVNNIKHCRFVASHSTAVRDAEAVDVIVSETLGNYALEENIIATVEDAKRFLKPGGTIIPGAIEQFVCPVVDNRFYRELTVWDEVGFGLDFGAARTMSLNNIYVRTFAPDMLLDGGKAAQRWDRVDFALKNKSNRKGEAEWLLSSASPITGFAVWWRCDLGPGIELSTSPLAPPTHWEQLYFPLLEPFSATTGDRLHVALSSRSSYQEGTTLRWQAELRPKKGKVFRQTMDLEAGFVR